MFIQIQRHIVAKDTIQQVYPKVDKIIVIHFKGDGCTNFIYDTEQERDQALRNIRESLIG